MSRKGKGDSTYWSQCIEQFEHSREGFEVICPNCLEIERLNNRLIKNTKTQPLPDRALVWNGAGFGQSHPWANEKAKEMTVLFIKGLDVYVYKQWNKPICDVDQLAYWFQVDVFELTEATEAITLVR